MTHSVFALAYWSDMKYVAMDEVWQILINMSSPKGSKNPCPTLVVSIFSHCKYSSRENFDFYGCFSFSVSVPFSTSWLHPKNICKFDI